MINPSEISMMHSRFLVFIGSSVNGNLLNTENRLVTIRRMLTYCRVSRNTHTRCDVNIDYDINSLGILTIHNKSNSNCKMCLKIL